MVNRIEVGFKKGMKDALGDSIRKRIIEDLHINVDAVRTIEVYSIDADLSDEQLMFLEKNYLQTRSYRNFLR